MLNRKRFIIIFIVSLVAIAATLYFKPRETWKVIELGRIHQSVINSFIFSPDGKIIATSNDREVTLWNLEAEKIRTLLSDTTKAKIKSFVFSPDGQLIVTASNTGVTLWNTQGKQLWTSPFIAQDSYIPVVYFHPDGKMIVALGNKEVKLWNLNGEEIQTLHHKETIEEFRFSLDGQTIATRSRQEVKLWSRSGEKLQILKRSGLITLTVPGRVYPKGYVGSFEYVGFSPDGRTIITIGDGNVNLWSKEGKLLKNLSTLMAYTVAPNSNNTAILTWHPQGARLWNYQGKLLYFFEHLDMSYSQGISWSPDNQIVATAGSDGVTLWKAEDGKSIQTLPRISLWNIIESIDSYFDDIDNYSCGDVSFSSNGQIIAAICKFYSTGIFKSGLRLWSRDGQELWTPDENGYDSYVFSPDSQTLAVKHKGQLILLKLSVRKR
jgi:FOG: WD40 repeat